MKNLGQHLKYQWKFWKYKVCVVPKYAKKSYKHLRERVIELLELVHLGSSISIGSQTLLRS